MKALIVDDEPGIVYAFERYFASRGDQTVSAATAERGIELARSERPDLIILDVKLPGMDGLAAVEKVREFDRKTPILVITAHGTLETAVQATRVGAFDYLTKPVDIARLDELVQRALGRSGRSQRIEKLRREELAKYAQSGLVGQTPAMHEIFKQIGSVCATDTSVLITGESGSGKELIARAIHTHGPRAQHPFETINCACIPENLVESELFGHRKGAFTGAVGDKTGKFEIAHRGTLFLDEVSELPSGAQAKLLRVIEEKTFERLGSTDRQEVDVRIVAATNSRLEERVAQGKFREDLFYRLNVFRIEVPPLRQRPEDVPLLIAYFLDRHDTRGITEDAVDLLQAYRWPGNVRELRNVIERAHIVARGAVIEAGHLPEEIRRPRPTGVMAGDRLDALIEEFLSPERLERGRLMEELSAEWEKRLLEKIMRRADGSQVRAARLLGINRVTLRKKLKEHGLYDRYAR